MPQKLHFIVLELFHSRIYCVNGFIKRSIHYVEYEYAYEHLPVYGLIRLNGFASSVIMGPSGQGP